MIRAQSLSVLLAAGALFPVFTASCGSKSTSSPTPTCTNGTIVAAEENDYSFTSQIKLHPVTVKSMSDLTFDWGGVTTDFLGHHVDPVADLNSIFVLLVNIPSTTLENQLDNDTFSQASIQITPPPLFSPTGPTSGSLFEDFTVGGQAVDLTSAGPFLNASTYNPSNSTFAVVAQSGPNLGSNIHMLQSFELSDSSTNTKVTLTNSSTTLTYTANLHDLHPTGVPANTASLTLDWSQIQTNALGNSFGNGSGYTTTSITSAIVGHYTQSLSELEGKFLDLQMIAQDLYTATTPYGTTLDFTTLKDSNNNSFSGITSDGTWLVGLICGGCENPAPWYMTVLTPVPQPCASTN
jgi:hypothetical protein